jgi:hypothetical protein
MRCSDSFNYGCSVGFVAGNFNPLFLHRLGLSYGANSWVGFFIRNKTTLTPNRKAAVL